MSTVPRNDPAVLTSWKDIAQYIGKGVRTVQRWEQNLGLPVRRTKPGEKGIIFAVPREIDTWVRSQQRTDRAALLQALDELRKENQELRRRLEDKSAHRATSSIASGTKGV